jgi:hypothetical protein
MASTPTNTPTGTPAVGPAALLGDRNVEQSIDTNPSGMAEAFPYRASASGTATTLHVYIDRSNAAAHVVVGLYGDASGNPGTLLAQATITGPVGGAWNVVGIPSTPITSGARYWIAVLAPSGDGLIKFRDTARGNAEQTSAQTTLTTFPTKWTTGTIYYSSPMSAYAS